LTDGISPFVSHSKAVVSPTWNSSAMSFGVMLGRSSGGNAVGEMGMGDTWASGLWSGR